MKSLGICIGASNISLVLVSKNNDTIEVLDAKSIPHEGNPRNILLKELDINVLKSIDYISVSGRKFRNILNVSSISEPEALEYAFRHTLKYNESLFANIIVSAGGETFVVYELDPNGHIINVHTGNKCASGTGEFFLQQIRRMNFNIDNAILNADKDNPYKLSGRCSVFCKSDCTHALNKGAPKGQIVAGLCEMMALKISELLYKTKAKQILLIGGTSDNQLMLDYLIKKTNGKNIIVPPYARSFEALGAALWALEQGLKAPANIEDIFNHVDSSFVFLPPLKDSLHLTTFNTSFRGKLQNNDECILGLDVGSTTTKAVLIRESDQEILASAYLRTNGDPIIAARNCYKEIQSQIDKEISIIGLGVTGSGRQISALHALTPAIINEILAHATAAVYFDAEVDTIFEIGGQDAKYTYITNGVASDYAMNEACSAGTGSFLEESAWESLGIAMEDIADIAFQSKQAPNFNDQCAAFISSDIKTAIQEGIDTADIVAGLVYSVCMNYSQRVKGNRKIGKKIFMQGGVCYNQAIPVAMAALTGKQIIVAPEPGLMGAFGVALQIREQINNHILPIMSFDLNTLINREVVYLEPFYCKGGKENCDRKCKINRIKIADRTFPFGGACNMYVNEINEDKKLSKKTAINYVKEREQFLYEEYAKMNATRILASNNKKIGLLPSLQTTALYPLYYNFFYALGFDILTADEVLEEGINKKGAAFCFPVELSYGLLAKLIKLNPDYFFIPHVKYLPVINIGENSTTCPFVQGEPYYLKSAFKEIDEKKLISPVLEMKLSYADATNTFIKIGKRLGFSRKHSKQAFDLAINAQNSFNINSHDLAQKFLKDLEANPDEFAFVLLGRPYNAFNKFANMGIPGKISSRGFSIIPCDFLTYIDSNTSMENMYWTSGQEILNATSFVKNHPQLFPIYISNFSCGPDSFLISYFRKIMEQKPSLTLELDSHTADAGLDTRIEAFVDVVRNYLELNKKPAISQKTEEEFNPARIILNDKKLSFLDSKNNNYPLKHPSIEIIIPSMGDFGSRILAAAFRHYGLNARALSEPGEKEFKHGQAYASCKECLPLILTLGSLIKYLEDRQDLNKNIVYFMPETSGPCRFGQYNVLIKNYIEEQKIENIALLSLTSENSYAGLGNKMAIRTWQSVLIADIMEEIYSSVLVLSKDKAKAIKVYKEVEEKILWGVEHQEWSELLKTLEHAAIELKKIDRAKEINDLTKIALIGEIYVRRDNFSRAYLVEKLATKNILVKTAAVSEWLYYCDYLIKNNILGENSYKDQFKLFINTYFKTRYEKEIKAIMAKSAFYEYHLLDVDKFINNAKTLISSQVTGETILTVGAAISEIIEEVSGVISIGPFGCMPNRMAEALISDNISEIKPCISKNKDLVYEVMQNYPALPFLSIETDGSQFTQLIESRIEAFCLQVERINKEIIKYRFKSSS